MNHSRIHFQLVSSHTFAKMLTHNHAANVWAFLNSQYLERKEIFEAQLDDDETTEIESDYSDRKLIITEFLNERGQEATLQMCGLTHAKRNMFYYLVEDTVDASWCSGRGRRSSFSPCDVCFMALTTMKHGGTWHFMPRMFRMRGPTL